MKAIGTLAALVLLAHGATAIAADSTSQVIRQKAPNGISASFFACISRTGSDAIGIGACLSTEKSAQDARLNTNYKALLSKLAPRAKDELVRAEREWLKFQDTNGEFENTIYGDEIIDNLQLTQNEIFRICERANALDTYLTATNLQ